MVHVPTARLDNINDTDHRQCTCQLLDRESQDSGYETNYSAHSVPIKENDQENTFELTNNVIEEHETAV